MSNALGYFLFFVSIFGNAYAPERTPSPPEQFPVARSMGCIEVYRVCKAQKRSTEIRQWTMNSKHGRKGA